MKCPKCRFDNPSNTKFCGNCATRLPIYEENFDAPTETLVTPLHEYKTGSILSDRYEIIEELGHGGMGKVYKAIDREINEKIALKLIRPEIAANKKIIERFRHEMKIARKISHRNVCRMFDIGKEGDSIYITMECISGEDLKKSIRRMGPLTLRKTLSLSKQICQGLAEAHQLGVVHRDLKPHNIMIDKEGNAKIMDFGIALSQEAKGLTDSSVIMGTPQYLSPEQVEGKKVDQRSDIYSLGVIMFEMVTGQVPFDGETTLSIAVKHKTEIPPEPRELNSQVPEDLNRLILKCLEKDPDKRYRSAEELYSDLTKIEPKMTPLRMIHPKGKTKFGATIARSSGYRWIGIVFLLALILIADHFFFHVVTNKKNKKSLTKIGSKKMRSMVILPFRSLNPEKGNEPFSLIMADSLAMSLHAFHELRIVGFTSALAYQDTKKDIREIGRELDVDYILDGTIWRSDGNIKINSQLGSVADGSLYWADSFTKSSDEVNELQTEITLAVAGALGVQKAKDKIASITEKTHSELLGNEYYTRGRYFQIRYSTTRSEIDFNLCVENYLKVVESNPNDAMTYWRLGIVHERRFDFTNDKSYLNSMFQYFQKAYEIDNDFAEANVGLGWSYFYKEDNAKAYAFFKRAYNLDPLNAEVNFHLGSFYFSLGMHEHALKFYSKAIEIDPVPLQLPLWYNLRAKCLGYLGRHGEAVETIERALNSQKNPDLYLNSACQLTMMKKYDEADIQISLAERAAANSQQVRKYRALLSAAKGDKSKALTLIDGDEKDFGYEMTNIYCLLEMEEKAIENIKSGIARGLRERHAYYYSFPYLANNLYFHVLRDDPRFLEIMNTEKKKYDEKLKIFGDS